MTEDYKCPCQEVDPDHFITNEEVKWLLENQDKYTFKQEDYLRVYNCIHCNDCGTTEERFLLKKKFLEDGNNIMGLEETISNLREYGTPFIQNKSRVRLPEGIPKDSKTLLYFGCFTTVKTPKYAENLIKYLIMKKIDFCLLDEEICCGYPILCNGELKTYNFLVEKNKALFIKNGYKRIITACPSCYLVFKKEYKDLDIKIEYFTEYLTPSDSKKRGNLIIQHACPLRNGEIPNIVENLERLYTKSGYIIQDKVPNSCCGGGVGHQLRTDILEAVAINRMEDFKIESDYIEELKGEDNFITAYCPDAYWILKVFGKRKKINFILKDMCDLLM